MIACMPRRFQIVDVFCSGPFTGNPLAVVLDAEGLSIDEMQRITRWLNLSETAFLLPSTQPQADYRVRIFTLDREMPFAGHPTLGSCHAWLRSGAIPRQAGVVVQECGVGLVPVRLDADRLAFAAPSLLRGGPVDEADVQAAADFLRIARTDIVDAQWADNGPGWLALLLPSAQAVLDLHPPRAHTKRIDLGVAGPYPQGAASAYELRAFFTDHHLAVMEDPVTGSLNASVAQWLMGTGRATAPYVASQGACLGRAGQVFIEVDPQGTVWVGGRATTCFAGECRLA
jgi:PhzF family phenazine biosynthesis protein